MEITFDTLPKAVSLIHKKLNRIEQLILNQNQPETDTWFDIDKLCEYHPSKPAKPTVYSWVRKKKIPYHKSGKKLIFLKSEIDSWLMQGRQKTILEIEAEADDYLRRPKNRSD